MSMLVNIRSLNKEDVEELNTIRRSEGVFETILSLKNESIDETHQYFTGERIHTFIAETKEKNKIIGYIKLVIDEEKRRRHKAKISIAIHNDYKGKGVGSLLFTEAIDLAENWLMLKKLELTVLENNIQGIELYKKFGFEVEGVSKADTVVNGHYADVVFMGKILTDRR